MTDERGRHGFRLNQAYIDAVVHAGGTPVLVPATLLATASGPDVLRPLFESLDGILLPGGADVQPERYGAAPHPMLGAVDPVLDETELDLSRWALAQGKPILGICRGQQCLNVAAGGTLYQDVPSEVAGALEHRSEKRTALVHEIDVDPDSRLAGLLGATRFPVNSLHHQAVRDVAPGFVTVARAGDGIIEGIERPDHPFAIAVQFHPEELVPGHTPSERLLRRFVEEVESRSARSTAQRHR